MTSKTPLTANVNQPPPGWLFVWSLHCGLDAPGGVATVIRELARSQLAASDYRPVLLSASWERLESTNLPKPLDRCYWRRLNPPLIRGKGFLVVAKALLKLPITILWLRKLLRREHVRVVNFHYPGLESFVFMLMRRCGIYNGKCVLSFHGTDLGNVEQTKGMERLLWQFILRSADLIALVCTDHENRLRNFVGRHSIATRVVLNGVPRHASRPCDPPAALRSISSTGPVLLSVGSFISVKRPRLVLDAFRALRIIQPQAVLVMVGGYGEELALIKESITEDESSHVVLAVNIPYADVGAFYHSCDLLLLASFSEGLPLVLLEAGLQGVPVVASSVNGVPEIVEDGVTGRLFPRDSTAQDIATVCLEVLESPHIAESLGQQLRERVEGSFTPDAVLQRYYSGLEDHLESGNSTMDSGDSR